MTRLSDLPDGVPLKVLLVDASSASAKLLKTLLEARKEVLSVEMAQSLGAAAQFLRSKDINTVFVDPISVGIEAATNFIFEIRDTRASTVFVLYLDFLQMERGRIGFYSGKRARFKHYYKLDKGTPAAVFEDEVTATVSKCQIYLASSLKAGKIQELQAELVNLGYAKGEDSKVEVSVSVLKEINEQLNSLRLAATNVPDDPQTGSVFLSYRFAEKDYTEGLVTLLEREKFTVVTGQDANTFISQAILSRVASCEFFVCLMTRSDEKKDGSFTTSPWLLEEKGAALALGKKIVLMVEDGVVDVGGLQGDWQRIHFSAKSFVSAAIRCVDQLRSYGG